MKNLILMTLLLSLIACGKPSTSSNIKKGSKLPYQITNTEDVGTTTDGVAGDSLGDISNNTGGEEEEASNDSNFLCTFSNQNETKTAELDIQNNGNVKVAILSGEGQSGKFTFDGYTISPSGNEEASVFHENEDELVENGKIIKISARIVMNENINEGELQVSYRIKNEDKSITETAFSKLADINNCTSN